MIKNLVFGGGGVKCISYIGLLKYFEENNILKNIEHIVGTSGGGIFALMVIIGYSYKDLKQLILFLDFNSLKDINCDNICKFNENYGIDTGDNLLQLIKIMIKKKNINEEVTFKDLYNKTNIIFTLTGTCIEKQSIEYFNYKLTPNMTILKAIRITYSIPIIYNCVRYNNYTYVDGGILENYPINFLKENIENTLGFYLIGGYEDRTVNSINNFILGILLSMIRKNEYNIVNKYINNTVSIKCNFSSIDFNISKEQKIKAIENGYTCIKTYYNKLFIRTILVEYIDNIVKNL